MTLLPVAFVVALAVSNVMALVFAEPIEGILNRIIADEIGAAWFRNLNFAILVAYAIVRSGELKRKGASETRGP